jgi:hypothetical protein
VRWDIFSGRKKEKTGTLRDGIENQVKRIERFAPKQYRSDREVRYYNYRLLDLYLKPLFYLLDTISQSQPAAAGDEAQLIGKLFLRLKDFYDPKQRLSLEEAFQDNSLKKKLGQVLLIFYGKGEITGAQVETYLEELKSKG